MPQPLADEFKAIPMSSNLGQSLERAHRFAREQSHRLVTLEHLLLALAEDPEAALILRSANVDLARLGTDVSGYLGGLLEDMRVTGEAAPKPDLELLRVLQAAASAAQQSKRRQIDGAIVLAAIVGDGKSPAAGLLKALGMTFEEAIRALQRSNTQARLKPKVVTPGAVPGRAPAVAPPPAPADPPPPAAPAMSAPPSPSQSLPPAPAAAPAGGPAAEDFLAAARARIQQRGGGKPARGPAPPDKPPAPAAASPPASAPEPVPVRAPAEVEPSPEPVDAVETEALTQAIEAAMTAPPARRADPVAPSAAPLPSPPPGPAASGPARPAWTPPPDPRAQPAARLPQPPPVRAPIPFPGRSVPPGEGPVRPPLPPPRTGAAVPVPAPPAASSLHVPPAHAPPVPWPEGGARAPVPRSALNGDLGHAGYHPAPGPAPAGAKSANGARAPAAPRGAYGERGPLVENIPRRMRVGVPAGGEVRIARDRIEGLLQALNGAGAPQRGAPVARALTVRLRAPSGGFAVEATAPETQWVESASSLMRDDDAVWSWTVVPNRRGRSRLLLMVSARSVGPDGAGAETAPPDRVIDVRVRPNYGRALARWAGLLAALSGGVLLGRFGEALWPALVVTFREITGF